MNKNSAHSLSLGLQITFTSLKYDYKTFKQATGTMILLVYVGSMVI